jgi:hypothetical protein
LQVISAVVESGGKNVTVYVDFGMVETSYDFAVTGVKDLRGNQMASAATGTFPGSDASENTPPEILSHSPGPGDQNVGLQQSVVVRFSEPMRYSQMVTAYSWTGGGGDVPADVEVEDNVYVFRPLSELQTNTTYTFALTSNAWDMSGNSLAPTSWNFTTTSSPDVTAPRFVGSTPGDGATDVSTGTNFELRFSERINPERELTVFLTPNPGDGVATWSTDGTRLTFDPDENLMDNTMYTFVLPEGAVEDMSGNLMRESAVVRFTTDSNFPQGRISGTISGDPDSDDAFDPQGAVVLASSEFLFTAEEPAIEGAGIVGADGRYDITELPDDDYFLVVLLDSNGDDELNPDDGDAAGAYGFHPPDDENPDAVPLTGGVHVQDIDFRLWDASVINGNVFYAGTEYRDILYMYNYHVGLFDTTLFDPENVPPAVDGDGPFDMVWETEFHLGGLDEEDRIVDGTYYVGAFLDGNGNDDYDPDVDPTGLYMVDGSLVPVTVENGRDAMGIVIYLEDPPDGGTRTSAWRAIPRDAEKARRAQLLRNALKNAVKNADRGR